MYTENCIIVRLPQFLVISNVCETHRLLDSANILVLHIKKTHKINETTILNKINVSRFENSQLNFLSEI